MYNQNREIEKKYARIRAYTTKVVASQTPERWKASQILGQNGAK